MKKYIRKDKNRTITTQFQEFLINSLNNLTLKEFNEINSSNNGDVNYLLTQTSIFYISIDPSLSPPIINSYLGFRHSINSQNIKNLNLEILIYYVTILNSTKNCKIKLDNEKLWAFYR